MDQVSFCASQFSGIPTPKLGMVAPGEGASMWVLGLLITIKTLTSDTGGSYSVVEGVIHPGHEVARHVHTLEDEMWYMLEGELIWNLGGRESLARTGSFIHLPKFVAHSLMNRSDKPAKMLNLFAPGGFEQWFRDVGRPMEDPSQPPPDVTKEELSQALLLRLGPSRMELTKGIQDSLGTCGVYREKIIGKDYDATGELALLIVRGRGATKRDSKHPKDTQNSAPS